jgi:hypothetical protein
MHACRLATALSIMCVVLCSGCRTVKEATLLGTYRLETPCTSASLTLNSDHTFEQNVRTSSGESSQLKGKWKLGHRSANAGFISHVIAPVSKPVQFEPFLDIVENGHAKQVSGAFFVAESLGRVIRLGPLVISCPNSASEVDYTKY